MEIVFRKSYIQDDRTWNTRATDRGRGGGHVFRWKMKMETFTKYGAGGDDDGGVVSSSDRTLGVTGLRFIPFSHCAFAFSVFSSWLWPIVSGGVARVLWNMCCPLDVGRPSMLLLSLYIRVSSDYNVKYVRRWKRQVGNQIVRVPALAHHSDTCRTVRAHREQISGVQLSKITVRRGGKRANRNRCYVCTTHTYVGISARTRRAHSGVQMGGRCVCVCVYCKSLCCVCVYTQIALSYDL